MANLMATDLGFESRLPIDARYLLVSHIPVVRDEYGRYYTQKLWAKDLFLHLGYISELTLAAPCRFGLPEEDQTLIDVDRYPNLSIAELPETRGWGVAFRSFGNLNRRLKQLVNKHDIVHLGVVGWPLPPGWVAARHAVAADRFTMTMIESAPWRSSGNGWQRFRDRMRSRVFEYFSHRIIRQSDLALFTHSRYKRQLAGENHPHAHVIPASWIDEEFVIDEQQAVADWTSKIEAGNQTIRLLFAG